MSAHAYMPAWRAWWGRVGMVLTWSVWMFGSAIHYTYLPRCLSRSFASVVEFAILQAAVTGAVSWSMRRFCQRPTYANLHQAEAGVELSVTPASVPNPANILVAGAAFAVAITMTNASVAYGSVSGSRMIKSLEPAIVAGIQLMVGMDLNHRADLPWVMLLAIAVCMMLAVAPTGITILSAAAALLSTAGISTRNVFVKRHMLAAGASKTCGTSSSSSSSANADTKTGAVSAQVVRIQSDSRWAADAQTSLNFVACAILILILLASGFVTLGSNKGTNQTTFSHARTSDLVIACMSFAGFQVAALMVLEEVTPTRQAGIKSLQSALTTAWALVIDRKGKSHTSLEIVPALVWGLCVTALAIDAQLGASATWHHAERLDSPMSVQRQGPQGPRKGAAANGTLIDMDVSLEIDVDGGENSRHSGFPTGGPQGGAVIAARVWLAVYCACITAILLQCAVMAFNATAGGALGTLRSGHRV